MPEQHVCHILGARTPRRLQSGVRCTSLSSLLCVRLSVAFCSLVSWAHKSHARWRVARAAWIYRAGAGVGKGKLTLDETRSFLKDQRAGRFGVEAAAPSGGWIYVV